MRYGPKFYGKGILTMVAIAVITIISISSFAEASSNPLPIYGYVTYDGNGLSGIEVRATNERTGGTLTETSDENGAYTVTFGGPVYGWEVGDTIKLKARGTGNYECLGGGKEITITSDEPIRADITLHLSLNAGFAFTPENPKAEDNVSFTDISTGTITNHTWNFGDGNISYEQNPVHAYASEGNYTVVLTIYCHTFSTSASSLLHAEKQEVNDTDNSNETNGTGSTPGFLLPSTIAALCVMLAIFKRRRYI
ncbi:MAG: PKD domain-containing protein [Candidatus Thermoplasmatota archaeon]|nr:PKD domain-containing protein [Candidatus Thermoplasmatota archaeon]